MKKEYRNFNRLITFMIAVAMFLIVLPSVTADCPTGIVSYWKLDEGSGTTATDVFNGNHGTIYGDSTWVDGIVGKALSFDGSGDYVEIPDDDSLSFVDGDPDEPFSVSAWVYMRNTINKQRFVGKANSFASGYGEYLLTTTGANYFGFYLCDASYDGYSIIGRYWNQQPSLNRWYHLVGTYDGSGETSGIKLYVDGVRVDNVAQTNGPYNDMENTDIPVYLGYYPQDGTYLNGMLDEVTIWNKELTSDEISNIYCLNSNGIGYTDDFEYTGNLVLPLSTDPVTLEAALTNPSDTGVEGCDVIFYLNDVFVGSTTTNEDGVASLDIGSLDVGVYEVYASVCCLETDHMLLAVYDSDAGFVTGGGWIDSPVGAYKPDPTLYGKANFGFVSKYKKGQSTPDGNTEFQFKAGDINFHSSSYEWLVITGGSKAMFKGIGTINGEGSYKFMITAQDINGGDTFRIKIWEEDTNGDEIVIYDNGVDTVLGGGQIKIHSK